MVRERLFNSGVGIQRVVRNVETPPQGRPCSDAFRLAQGRDALICWRALFEPFDKTQARLRELVRTPQVDVRPLLSDQTGRHWFWALLPEQKACPEPAEGASPAGAKPGHTKHRVDIATAKKESTLITEKNPCLSDPPRLTFHP